MKRLLLLLWLLPGCALFQALFSATLEEPRLSFKGARLSEVTLGTVTLETVWEVDNPNAVGVTLARADCHIAVEDQPVATGAPPAGFSMPAHAKTELSSPPR